MFIQISHHLPAAPVSLRILMWVLLLTWGLLLINKKLKHLQPVYNPSSTTAADNTWPHRLDCVTHRQSVLELWWHSVTTLLPSVPKTPRVVKVSQFTVSKSYLVHLAWRHDSNPSERDSKKSPRPPHKKNSQSTQILFQEKKRKKKPNDPLPLCFLPPLSVKAPSRPSPLLWVSNH